MLAAVLGELHRAAQRTGRQRHQQLLGPRMVDLHPEPAAHVGRDHVDLAEVEAHLHRQRGSDTGRALRRGPDLQAVDVRVPPRDRAATLQRSARAALDRQVQGEPVRSRGDGRARVTGRLLQSGTDVAGHVLVHQGRGRACGLHADDRRQELVVDPDARDGVLSDVPVLGDDEGDRLADVVDLVLGQRVLGAAVGERRVRDQQRQRLRHPGSQRTGEVVVGVDGVHALDVEHGGDVDVEDASVCVGRPQHGGVERRLPATAGRSPDADVVDVATLPTQEALVLDPLDPLAHQLGGHEPDAAPSSAARSTALTMFW